MGNPVHLITTVVAAPLTAVNRLLGGSAHTQGVAHAIDRQLGIGGGGGWRPLKLFSAPFVLPTQVTEAAIPKTGPIGEKLNPIVQAVNEKVFGVVGVQEGRTNIRPLVLVRTGALALSAPSLGLQGSGYGAESTETFTLAPETSSLAPGLAPLGSSGSPWYYTLATAIGGNALAQRLFGQVTQNLEKTVLQDVFGGSSTPSPSPRPLILQIPPGGGISGGASLGVGKVGTAPYQVNVIGYLIGAIGLILLVMVMRRG